MIGSAIEAGKRNITAYATMPAKDRTVLTLINKEPSFEGGVVVDASTSFRSGSLVRLSGSSLESKSGTTLGDAAVSSAGLWKPAREEEVSRTRTGLQVRLPAASAAIVTLHA
jgi:hypothetical protein